MNNTKAALGTIIESLQEFPTNIQISHSTTILFTNTIE